MGTEIAKTGVKGLSIINNEGELVYEKFKNILNYEGLYQISNFGRVKSLNRLRKSHYGNAFVAERILKSSDKTGYVRVRLCKNYNYTNFSIHRLVGIAFIPNPDNKPEINHKDGIKTNNYLWNLEWNTKKENSQHAFRTGLKSGIKGSLNTNSILTEADVLEIRSIGKCITQQKIGEIYNIDRRTVGKILAKKSWNHI